MFFCLIFSSGAENGLLLLSLSFLTVEVWREVTAQLCKWWEGVGVKTLHISGTQEMRHSMLLIFKVTK